MGDGVGEKPRVSLKESEEEQMRQCRSRIEQLNGKGYFDWCMLDANPHMGGHFVWSYNDYARGSQMKRCIAVWWISTGIRNSATSCCRV